MRTISYRRWSPPQSPLSIEFPAEVLRELRLQIAEGDGNGILYGWRVGPDARVLAARPWPDAWPVTPPEVEEDPRFAGLQPVGIFVCRRRGEIFLTEADLRLFENRRAQMALVAAGDHAGFFARESDGSFCTIRSYEEFPLADAPVPAPAGNAASRIGRRRRSGWSWAAAVAIPVLAIPLASVAYFTTPLLPPQSIALAVTEREGQLVLTWNPRAIAPGSQVEIVDGPDRTVLPLAPGQGSATYCVRQGDVEVIVTGRGGRSETARFVTRAPEIGPPPEIQQAREEVARLEQELVQLRQESEEGRQRIQFLTGRVEKMASP